MNKTIKNINDKSDNNLKYEIVKFVGNQFVLDVRADKTNETVWLTQKEIAKLFDKSVSTINEHIKKILEDELDEKEVVKKFGKTEFSKKPTNLYNLDMILAVGYRVNSKIGILFRRWANKILKEYLVDGYAINNKRMLALNKTIEIQNKMLANTLDVETNELKNIIDLYTNALKLIDNYDHQCVEKPRGNIAEYILKYNECKNFINNMRFTNDSNIFGIEKSPGQLEGILACINQTALGEEIYKSLEEKAANLLYFIVKDHPFIDGCKRIAAGLFLFYLSKNALLSINKLTISNGTLTAITLLVAESRPEEKEIMINIIMTILFNKM